MSMTHSDLNCCVIGHCSTIVEYRALALFPAMRLRFSYKATAMPFVSEKRNSLIGNVLQMVTSARVQQISALLFGCVGLTLLQRQELFRQGSRSFA